MRPSGSVLRPWDPGAPPGNTLLTPHRSHDLYHAERRMYNACAPRQFYRCPFQHEPRWAVWNGILHQPTLFFAAPVLISRKRWQKRDYGRLIGTLPTAGYTRAKGHALLE